MLAQDNQDHVARFCNLSWKSLGQGSIIKLKFNLLSFLPNPKQESAGVFQEKAHSVVWRERWKFNEEVKIGSSKTKSIAPKAFSTSQEQVRRLGSKEHWQFQEEAKSVAPRACWKLQEKAKRVIPRERGEGPRKITKSLASRGCWGSERGIQSMLESLSKNKTA